MEGPEESRAHSDEPRVRPATEADAAPGGAVDKPTELELALRGEGKKRTVKPKPADDVPATDKSEEVWL